MSSPAAPSNTRLLSGWGNYPKLPCQTFRPEEWHSLLPLLQTPNRPFIARGSGLSYGDAALLKEGVLLTERLNRFIAFDSHSGIITAEAGVTLAEILEIIIPKGWFLPVLPGTKFVSLGGCIASNVHGKNHYRMGCFASHVTEIVLLLADGTTTRCSPSVNTDLFWLTSGGMGMTGIIKQATLQLRPIHSNRLEVTRIKVDSIREIVALFRDTAPKADYNVAWIDHFADADTLGRGYFEFANHVQTQDGSLSAASLGLRKPKISVPCFAPKWLLNRYTMALYNHYQFSHLDKIPQTQEMSFQEFFHPLDNIVHWNKLYGKDGFLQYQCILPESSLLEKQIHQLLSMIHQHQEFSFLAVLKYHGESDRSLLPFCMPGISIALDFPNRPSVHKLLDTLDEYVIGWRGRTYLAKDARMKPYHFRRMYASFLLPWQQAIEMADPTQRFLSEMAKRLGWKN